MDSIKNSLRELLHPNGSRANPARSCYDLFLCNPTYAEGNYWIDPNLGSIDDAVNVYCSRPGCSCIDCNDRSLSNIEKKEMSIEVSFTRMLYTICNFTIVQMSASLSYFRS